MILRTFFRLLEAFDDHLVPLDDDAEFVRTSLVLIPLPPETLRQRLR